MRQHKLGLLGVNIADDYGVHEVGLTLTIAGVRALVPDTFLRYTRQRHEVLLRR